MQNRDEMMPSGYDQEEGYFRQKDQELLEKKRAELDKGRQEAEHRAARAAWWMKCPKCGNPLTEVVMDEIHVDTCTGCGGVFFDKGELELLLESRTQSGVMAGLKKLFGR